MQENLSNEEQIKAYFGTWRQAQAERVGASDAMTQAKKTLSKAIDMPVKKITLLFKLLDQSEAKELTADVLGLIDKLD